MITKGNDALTPDEVKTILINNFHFDRRALKNKKYIELAELLTREEQRNIECRTQDHGFTTNNQDKEGTLRK